MNDKGWKTKFSSFRIAMFQNFLGHAFWKKKDFDIFFVAVFQFCNIKKLNFSLEGRII